MIIKAFSDSHGDLPKIESPFDLLVIAGDITPDFYGYYDKLKQLEWISSEFVPWVDNLPYKDAFSRVILIPGNHDIVFDNLCAPTRQMINNLLGYRVKLLINEYYQHQYLDGSGIRVFNIFGTPYCTEFGSWSFMPGDDKLMSKYSEIPSKLDLLISHDSPNLCGLGTISQGSYSGYKVGNDILTKRILEVKPKIVLSGHIHSGNHNLSIHDGMILANVSLYDTEGMILSDGKILELKLDDNPIKNIVMNLI